VSRLSCRKSQISIVSVRPSRLRADESSLSLPMNASVLLVKALGGGWRIDAPGQSGASASMTATRDVDFVR
jgi:hypothetical protein